MKHESPSFEERAMFGSSTFEQERANCQEPTIA